ncbi:unnamed protein product [Auanema sp. JU1783]|nr:unnamed protein product [Auanema sp. JU1783]
MSPEGFIPEEELEVLTKLSNAQVQVIADRSQLLLACCWRAHKFVSSIFTIVVNGGTDLDPKVIEDMAKYFWLQLTECKHCGAFESAVDGFYSLCSYLWKVEDDSLPHPARWAEEITLALEGKNDLQKLCSTRRSGGVPHLVTSIMASEPLDREGDKSIFSRVFDSLLNMEAKELEYRVHSLNVLKAIISSSKLGERILFAVERICVVSINSCSAESWSERNAGAQLAAALRIRIFGVSRNSQKEHEVDSKNKLSAFDFFSRYPALYEKLYEQLQGTTTDNFKCYPILIFLSHLTPTVAEKFPLAPFIPACLHILFTAKSEKLRNLTAATITSISQEQDLSWVLHQAKKCSEKFETESVAHSILILINYTYRKLAKIKKHNEVASELLPCVLPFLERRNLCDYNLNILYTILNSLKVSFQPIISKEINLTWRPIAASNILQKNVRPHIKEKALRFEYYRTFQKVSEFSGRDELLDWACSDLSQCKIEREFFEVLSFLLNNLESKTEHLTQKLKKTLRTPKLFTSLKSWLLSKKLYYSICVPLNVDSEDFSWLKTVSENDEDDNLKEIALEVSDLLLSSHKTPEFIAHLSLFLQDECEEIRNMAAKIVSKHFLQRNMPLSSEICLRLIMGDPEIHKNYIKLSKYSERKRDALFDVCNSRPYAEEKVFGENHFVMDFVSNMLIHMDQEKLN